MNEVLYKNSRGRRSFLWINRVILAAAMLVTIIPLLNTLSISFSSDLTSGTPGVMLWPKEFSMNGYKVLFEQVRILSPLINNSIVTLGGTFLHVLFCMLTGYALSRGPFPGKKIFIAFMMLTMMIPIQNIMIPLYILYRDLKLLNTLWAVTLTGMITGYTVILLKNFFERIPESIREAAVIDGASELTILWRIYFPLAKPGLATVTLFQFVEKWNHFTESLLFLNDPRKFTLQQALKKLVIDNDAASSAVQISNNAQMAGVIVAILPLLLLYPFLQRYFISGLTLGASKG
jgi:putative aldouronate transport system permease protein